MLITMQSQLVVGFDLDMTLVDSAAGIADALVHVCAIHGVTIQKSDALATIGLPLDQVFPLWLPGIEYEQLLDEYRAHYGVHGIPKSTLLPGAKEAVDVVKELGGRTVVVSAKKKDFVDRVLNVVNLEIDVTYGYLFAEHKGDALRKEHAHVYVGDHPGDIQAARAAGARSVVVITGPSTEGDLRESNPDVVFNTLLEFPEWLRREVDELLT